MSLRSWLFTLDHKRIGILFIITLTLFFFIGGAAAALIRIDLIDPAGLAPPALYNRMFTAHGILMVWFFLLPIIPAGLGNFVLPLMIGAHDVAFPRLNLMSWYILAISGGLAFAAIFIGGLDTGWTFYEPFTADFTNGHVIMALAAVFLSGFSSISTGLNFIVTTHRLRAPGMTWYRLPVFVWTIYATSVIFVLATPVLAATLLMSAVQRFLHVGVFDPALGGDPILFQHLFWFYSHPAVYIMILPGMGVVSELIPCFARKPLFGYEFVVWSSIGLAIIGFLVWGHHMFVAGISVYSALVFSMMSFFVAVPSAIKVFNWTATLHDGWISFDAPMLYALGFVILFTIGGLTGLFVATLGFDEYVHDTYFVIAHFHYIMVGGMVSAFFGGLHYWWPKMTGRLYNEWWARIAALLIFFGFNLTFFPQFILGYLGMPRRLYAYPPEWQFWNVLSSAGAAVLAVAYALPLFYLGWSLFRGERAGPNPWGATGLEWQTPSPPPKHNFETTPIVTRGPYQYTPEPIPQNA
ncbi:MAG TPA: cbb3-type cytochrome c oxidase subunit I [Stellaceae bacterium]|nr:cbb3-type cytochrome c oxidase subunit I [Stellaceae bacterium]